MRLLSSYLKGWLKGKGIVQLICDPGQVKREIENIKLGDKQFKKIKPLKFRPRFNYEKYQRCEPIAVLKIKSIVFILTSLKIDKQINFIFFEPLTGFCLSDYAETEQVALFFALCRIYDFTKTYEVKYIPNYQKLVIFIQYVIAKEGLSPSYIEDKGEGKNKGTDIGA